MSVRIRNLIALVWLSLLAVAVDAAETITLAWDASPDAEVTGYRLYFGPASATYTNTVDIGAKLTTDVTLTPGTFYFVVTAYTAQGLESDPSNEISYSVRPGKPLNLRITVQSSTNLSAWVDGPAVDVPLPEEEGPQRFYRARLALVERSGS